jgi:hypothetical protein
MVLAMQLLRALVYLILLDIPTKLSLLPWLLLAIPSWLLLAILLTRGSQSRKMGEWMVS